ncbi:MAG: hypothetical protein Q9222_004329 [Ikaeria aurantiellina]
MAVCQVSALKGSRTTASKALLVEPPVNLSIMTNTVVEKILFDAQGQKAVGVQTSTSKIYATREVILSAGALDSPKLLLLSGIGPRDDLKQHAIPLIRHLPGIGKNLHDHLWLELVTVQKADHHHRTSYINTPAALEEARVEWMQKEKGPLADYFLPQMIAYLKSDELVKSEEFLNLEEPTQMFHLAETRPHYELISVSHPLNPKFKFEHSLKIHDYASFEAEYSPQHIPSISIRAPEKYLATAVAFMSREASGEVTLQSSSPGDPPKTDPKFLDHPFDRRAAIDSVRRALDFLDTPGLAESRERIGSGPIDRTDEEILKFVQATGISMWHMCGTVKMGKPTDSSTCVDNNFHVVGVEGLRVADMSVAPLLPSAHTQAVAYLVGAVAADKIVAEYS